MHGLAHSLRPLPTSYSFPGSPCWRWPPPSLLKCRVTSRVRALVFGPKAGLYCELRTLGEMKISHSWGLVKLLTASAVLLLSAQILVCRVTLSKHHKPRPLPADEYRIVSPETYQYIHNQPGICKERSPFLVFMVPVSPAEAEAREAVRKTWGASHLNIITLFYVGLLERQEMVKVQEQLDKESRIHADIIQMNFRDSYQNLTIKTMMMMNWLATFCPEASYAMKVDFLPHQTTKKFSQTGLHHRFSHKGWQTQEGQRQQMASV